MIIYPIIITLVLLVAYRRFKLETDEYSKIKKAILKDLRVNQPSKIKEYFLEIITIIVIIILIYIKI